MNVMTLKPFYPLKTVKTLTAIQLISMHLFIWRPDGDGHSQDPLFGPYISTLPRDFSSHPLTWIVCCKHPRQGCTGEDVLLQSLPPGISSALECLYSRFLNDWYKVRSFMVWLSVSVGSSHPNICADAVPCVSSRRTPQSGHQSARACHEFLMGLAKR